MSSYSSSSFYPYPNTQKLTRKDKDKQPLVQEVIERTSVDIRLPVQSFTTQPPIPWCTILAVGLFALAMIANYMFDIYFSMVVDNINMSMWLTVNGFLGIYITLNGLMYWYMTFYPETCKPCMLCVKGSHIVITMISFPWTILGWIFFFFYPKEVDVLMFETFMWCQLSFQTMITVFFMYVSYLFLKNFYNAVPGSGY